MEPISITGAISLAGNIVSKLGKYSAAVVNAKDEIIALQNEITDLQVVLMLWKAQERELQHVMLRRLMDTLAEVTNLQESFSRSDKGGAQHFRRNRWVWQKRKVGLLKQELQQMLQTGRDLQSIDNNRLLHSIDGNLAAGFAAIQISQATLSDEARQGIAFTRTITDELREITTRTEEYVKASSSTVESRLAAIQESQIQSAARLAAIQESHAQDAARIGRVELQLESMHIPPSLKSAGHVQSPLSITLRQCGISCKCRCHSRARVSSPAFLDRLLGRLFLGYVGYPIKACKDCARSNASSLSLTYTFPKWWLGWSMLITAGRNVMGSPELMMRLDCRKPNTHDSLFRHASHGNLDAMRSLLSQGLASPNQLCTKGMTAFAYALHYAASSCDWRPCQLLIQAGADLTLEQDNGSDDELNIIRIAIASKLYPEKQEWMGLLASMSALNSLPDLHKAVLRLTQQDVDSAIYGMHHSMLNDTDEWGLTALHWASFSGALEAVQSLINAGTDCSLTSHEGMTPIHLASISGQRGCVDALLTFNASTAHRDRCGNTALHYAALVKGKSDIVESLLRSGAELEAKNSSDYTPLELAIVAKHDHTMRKLLEFGADVDILRDGYPTLISSAVRAQASKSLRMLLKRGPVMNARGKDGTSLWHDVASHGTSHTLIELLPHLQFLDPTVTNDLGQSPLDILACREQACSNIIDDGLLEVQTRMETYGHMHTRRTTRVLEGAFRFLPESVQQSSMSRALEYIHNVADKLAPKWSGIVLQAHQPISEESLPDDQVRESIMQRYPGLASFKVEDSKHAKEVLFSTEFRALFTRAVILVYKAQRASDVEGTEEGRQAIVIDAEVDESIDAEEEEYFDAEG